MTVGVSILVNGIFTTIPGFPTLTRAYEWIAKHDPTLSMGPCIVDKYNVHWSVSADDIWQYTLPPQPEGHGVND